jgi:tRNA A-37 threonylcarbamoyl transferase component Bud32
VSTGGGSTEQATYGPGQTLGERYQIVRKVGHGSTSDVYEARDLERDQVVAVKVLNTTRLRDPVAQQRFHREAAVQAMIRHRNVAQIHADGVTAANEPFLVLELFSGRCLRTVMNEGPLELARARTFCLQALHGLAACHEVGVRHRDLKPENMMMRATDSGDEEIVLIDFGFASLAGQQRLTGDGYVVGSMSYLAPERLSGTVGDARADIYAMGVTMFELLTGQRPFAGEGAQLAYKHLKEAPPSPRQVAPDAGIPAELEAIALQALAKDPSARFQSASAMAEAVERCAVAAPTPTSERRFAVLYCDTDGVERTAQLAGEPLLVGRAPECALSSDDPLLSRHHARLFRGDDGRCWVEDLGSTNGIWVGADKVERAPVPPDELVLIGSLVLQVGPADAAAFQLRPGLHTRLWIWLKAARARLAEVEDERDALGHRLAELHDAIEKLSADRGPARVEDEPELAGEMQLLRDTARELRTALESAEKEKLDLTAEVSELRRDLAKTVEKRMAESFAAQGEKAQLAETLDLRTLELADARGKLRTRDEELSSVRRDLAELAQVATMTAQNEALALVSQGDRSRLGDRIGELEDRVDELRRELDDRDDQIAELRQEAEERAGDDPAELRRQLAELADELADARRGQQQSHAAAARLQVQLDLARGEADQLRGETGDRETPTITQSETARAALEERVTLIEAQNHELRSAVAEADAERVRLREQLAGARAEAEAAWAEVDHLREQSGGN